MKAVEFARWVILASAVIALCYVLWAYSSYPLLTAGSLARSAIPMLAGLFGLGWLTKYLYPSQTLFKYGDSSLISTGNEVTASRFGLES